MNEKAPTTTMSDTIELTCWVLGSDPDAIIIANVPRSNYAATLKAVIKDREPDFKDIAAHKLKLWKVSVFCGK